jgi:hypothetical protein
MDNKKQEKEKEKEKEKEHNELQDAIICPNCCIFRHGIMKNTLKQINPHASKQECDNFFSQGLIYGCGKPFIIIKKGTNIIVEICEYI